MRKRISQKRVNTVPGINQISRRNLLVSGGVISLSATGLFRSAHGLEPALAKDQAAASFRNDPDYVGRIPWRMHMGKGEIDVKIFFQPDTPSHPAHILLYDIPPGGSEGVHTHRVTDATGAWDEFYYILSGSGQMPIAGEMVPVKAGDHVYTPRDVAHGIENTSTDEHLRVYLLAMFMGKE